MTRSAYDRIVRTLALSIGIGAMLFTFLGLTSIIPQLAILDPIYSVASLAVFSGLPIVIAVGSFRLPIPAIRALAGVHAVSSYAFLILWVPAMQVPSAPDIPWIINTIAVATSEATLAFGIVVPWLYLLVVAITSGVVRFMAYGGGDPGIALQDSIMIILISGFMLALLQLTIVSGRHQDAAALAARNNAAADAATQTLERQRTRYQAFTHDDVLATLLAAAHDGPIPSEVTLRSARHALEKMDQLGDEQPLYSLISLNDLDTHLRVAAASLDVPYESEITDGPAQYVPIDACDALTEALTEAMRNSVRHANWPDGREVTRLAKAVRLPDGVKVSMVDDGVGFNPRRVGLDRLGVRLSILERVNSQAGGEATIRSSRGSGANVTLTWRAGVDDES